MTIKAFIKTERKKRGAEAAAAAVEAAPATPADTPAPTVTAPADSEPAAVAGGEEENATMSGIGQDAVAETTADSMNEVSNLLCVFTFPCTYEIFGGSEGLRLNWVEGMRSG